MSEGAFNPAEHMIELPGRGRNGPTLYLPVAARIAWFRVDHPDGKLHVWKDQIDDRIAIFHAQAETADGAIAQGWGSETPQDFKDYIEKASTKAVGRALAALGYGTLQAGDELDEGARIVDTPKPQTTPRAGSAGPGREAPAPRSAPQRPTPPDRPAAIPSAAGPPSAVTPAEEARLMGRLDKVDAHYNGDKGDDGGAKPAKRPPTVAEALTAARNETLSEKARQYAAGKGLEAATTRDEAAELYTQLLRVVPDPEAFKAAYVGRNEALGKLDEVPS